MKADLHSHTVLSDGALNVDQLISQAKRVGLDYIAVTDHNSTHSIPAVLALGKELGINVIPGVEINSESLTVIWNISGRRSLPCTKSSWKIIRSRKNSSLRLPGKVLPCMKYI